ncbi:Intraflagellar_transport complex B [Hexamita inflata]|uniref:Subunit 20 n=1 Tax=Hexamita inflata TaxID=28002 RepID=A0AA86U2Q9_9EUKA|nr:Intraflagellar transport complex B [Hexamita inflata]CAI9963907.1 Intraflagellar transport complex B [Hexamita inflata]
MNATNDLTFDEEQRVHILAVDQQKEASQITATSKQYRETLNQFNSISTQVISQIEDLAKQTENKRRRALGLRALNASSTAASDFTAALGRAKLSSRQFELEAAKMEVQAFEGYATVVKQTKTAVVEIFGGQ